MQLYSILRNDEAGPVQLDFWQLCIEATDSFSFITQKIFSVRKVVNEFTRKILKK